MHTRTRRKVCVHVLTLTNVCDGVFTHAQTYCTNAHRLEFTHMQLSTWMHTHTHMHAHWPHCSLVEVIGEVGGLQWPLAYTYTHPLTHTLGTNSCPLTLDDPSCATKALSCSSHLLVFLCCCYGFLFRSWRFYCCVTAVPVYPVTAYCSLCPPSSPKLRLPLLEFRFASQVASYPLYCIICTARLMNKPGEVLYYEYCVHCCLVNSSSWIALL